MKKLYLFDFDGTLTHMDTMFLYLKFYDADKFRKQFIRYIPLFVFLKLNLVDAERVKKSFVSSILKGQRQTKIQEKSQEFFEKNFPHIFRQNALDFIKNMDRENTDSYIVSASLDIWVKPFADKLGIKLIATETEFENGIFTGNFKTKNCNGEEKVSRIKEAKGNKKYDKIIAFGDTSGDRPMLNFADEGHFQFFH